MDRRFTLALAALVLVGGALALWLSPQQRAPVPADPPAAPSAPAQSYVLAISWHPAFCEAKPNLPECRDQRSSDYTADHFALHGLWAENEYCGVSDRLIAIDSTNRWDDLPEIDVSDATWRALQRIMPGTRAQLERHEWLFHGTCSAASADTYFARATALVEAVNASPVRDLLAKCRQHVSRNQIRAAFDAAFGDGAGRKVRVDCEDDGSRTLIAELRINLNGDAMGTRLLRRSDPRRTQCRHRLHRWHHRPGRPAIAQTKGRPPQADRPFPSRCDFTARRASHRP